MNKINKIPNFPALECSEIKFEAIICLNSTLPAKNEINKLLPLPILAADGAADRLIEMKITPDYIIGDMDSVSSGIIEGQSKAKIVIDTNQESNDFRKVMKFALGNGYRRVIILGFHGGDLEHTFNNWSVLMGEANFASICILDNGRYGIPINKSFRLSTIKGEIISIIPQPRAILSTWGLRWPLRGELLELGIREGARNMAIGDSIAIEIHSGSIILFINSRIPYAPILIED